MDSPVWILSYMFLSQRSCFQQNSMLGFADIIGLPPTENNCAEGCLSVDRHNLCYDPKGCCVMIKKYVLDLIPLLLFGLAL